MAVLFLPGLWMPQKFASGMSLLDTFDGRNQEHTGMKLKPRGARMARKEPLRDTSGQSWSPGVMHIFVKIFLSIYFFPSLFHLQGNLSFHLVTCLWPAFKIINNSRGWCGSVDWVLACEPKGQQFNSQSGHLPGLWARSPVGGMREATTQWCFSPFLSPSLLLCLKINQ